MSNSSSSIINLAKDEKEKDLLKSPVHKIAHEVYDFADETVAHAEGVNKEELMLECYHKLGALLAQWAKKLDQIERVNSQPTWLKEYIEKEEKSKGRVWVDLGRASFGFEVEGLFFGKEKKTPQLSEDTLMVTEPSTMWMEDFNALISFCTENDLDFYVDGFNTHRPGRTMRVVVYKPKSGVPHTHREFREKALIAVQIYESLLRGADSIDKEKLLLALVDSGKFDREAAERILETLLASGRIQKASIIM
jgi:hypothetical protein